MDATTVGGLDFGPNVTTAATNDPTDGTGLAVLTVAGVTGVYRISIASGAATLVAPLGTGLVPVQGFAVTIERDAPALALTADGQSLLRFLTNNTADAVTVTLDTASLAVGEQMVGIDYRPATGQLFGLAVNAAADTGSLYRIDPQNGGLTLIGASAGLVTYAGTDLPDPATARYGIDFNPTVDRVRVTTSTGLNFRINPDTGAAVGAAPDGAISGANVSETAYTNSYGQALGVTGQPTTQYTLDAATDKLFIQNPPNSGTQTMLVSIVSDFDTSLPIDFTAVNGFDIPGDVSVGTANAPVIGGRSINRDNAGFVAVTFEGTQRLFRVNLGNGRAGSSGTIGNGTVPLAGLALGDRIDITLTQNYSGPNGTTWESLGSRFDIGDASMVVDGVRFSDAFDDFGDFRVGGTDVRPGNNVVETVRPFGTVVTGATGTMAGLSVTPEYAFLSRSATARAILTLSNPTGGAITVPVRYLGELGSDDDTILLASDGSVGPGLRWVLNDDANPEGADPALSIVYAGLGAQVSTSAAVHGGDSFGEFTVTVPAGATIRLLTFTELFGPQAAGFARLPVYDSVVLAEAAGLFAGIDTATRATIVNWNFDVPTAAAGGPYTVAEGGGVALSGTGTGTGATFEWDFDYDGVTFTADATGATPTFSAAAINGPATRTVALRVSIANGTTPALSTAVVTVTNVAPTATVTNNGPVRVGSPAAVLFSNVFDPGPGDSLTYSIDADGDGVFQTSGTAPGLSVTFAAPGSYTITARVSDGIDFTDSTTVIEVVALPTPPAADLSVAVTGGAPIAPGGVVTYTIVVSNTGPDGVADAAFAATLPAGLTGVTYTATPAGGATGATGGSGAPVGTLTLPAGASVTYTVTGTASAGASGALTLSASVSPPSGTGDPVPANNTASGTTTVLPPVIPPPLPPVTPIPVLEPGFAIGDGPGGSGRARAFDADGKVRFTLTPFPGTPGGVRVAEADFTGDGVPDLVAGTGVGGNRVRVYDGVTQKLLFDIAPFEATFAGGVWVSAGDLTGDGVADLVVSPDVGGGPVVAVYDGSKLASGVGAQLIRFLGIEDATFRGGVRTAVGDVDADGVADLIVTAGFGGGPRVALFDGSRLTEPTLRDQLPPKLVGDFFVFEDTLRNGAFVAAGDLDGDRFVDVIVGGGPGGGPRVFALSGRELLTGVERAVANFFAGNSAGRSGVTVTARDLDGDDLADLVVAPGTGGSPVAYAGIDIEPQGTPNALAGVGPFGAELSGVFVG